MANGLFQPGGFFGPMAPGVSPAVNPATLIGSGLYQNNPLAGFGAVANIQQRGALQQAQMQQWQAEQQRKQLEARAAMQARAQRLAAAKRLAGSMAREDTGASAAEHNLAPNVVQADITRRASDYVDLFHADPKAFADVVAQRYETPEQWEVMTREEKQAAGLPVDDPLRRNTATGKVERIGSPGITIQPAPTGFAHGEGGELLTVTGGPQDPLRISPTEAAAMRKEARPIMAAIRDVDRLLEIVEDPDIGTIELTGPVATEIEQLRGNIIASMGKLRDAGVLQEGEYRRFERQLKDPTSMINAAAELWSRLWNVDSPLIRSLETFRRSSRTRLEQYPPESGIEVPGPRPAIPMIRLEAEDEIDNVPEGGRFRTPDGREFMKVGTDLIEQ